MNKCQTIAFQKLVKMHGWNKRGNADAKYKRIVSLLAIAGFKPIKSEAKRGSADGSWMAGSQLWIHPLGIVARWYRYVGGVKGDNSNEFSLEIQDKRRSL